MSFQSLIDEIKNHGQLGGDDFALIKRAYQVAEAAHEGQFRHSGDPYVSHCVEVARYLARWRLDVTSIVAGLLHDTVEDTSLTLKEIEQNFDSKVAFIVDGVSKIGRQVHYHGNAEQAETLRKMVLSLAKDVRVVFVKLADRLHNMETLSASPIISHRRRATETVEIYAPLAYRLGMTNVSGSLEDLAFPYIYPKEYDWLKLMVTEHLKDGQHYLNAVRQQVEKILTNHQISYTAIDARVKRLSSLYKKLRRLNMDITQVYDLIALRIIVPTISDCYAALGIIHEIWPPMPGKIKDYIALPKPNGYRSLHTTVYCVGGKPTEFQIRTQEMHQENEFGLAAYWAYNQAKDTKNYKQGSRVVFARKSEFDVLSQLRNWQEKFSDAKTFFNSLKVDLFQDRIFVLTPKGEAVDLPLAATPIDFAYSIHSELGDTCIGAKVNGRLVPLDYELQSGDAVEILTQRHKKPSRSWLKFVKTVRARSAVKSALKETNLLPKSINVSFKITVEDRLGLMKDIAAVFSQTKVNIINIKTEPLKGSKFMVIKVTTSADKKEKIDKIILRLKRIKEVKEIQSKIG